MTLTMTFREFARADSRGGEHAARGVPDILPVVLAGGAARVHTARNEILSPACRLLLFF
jgi:hypothetical protein